MPCWAGSGRLRPGLTGHTLRRGWRRGRRPNGAPGVIASTGYGSAVDATRPAGDSRSLDEPTLACRIFGGIPSEATLVVASSMPVRDVEAFGLPRERPPRVLANRGANGIDGVVSTAIGVALATAGPTVALVGDLAFLHDVSALVGPADAEVDLTVVVADNTGGGIFSFLAPADALDGHSFDQLFGTPQASDPAAVAAGFGWPVVDIGPGSPVGAFDEALARASGSGERSVIVVRLPSRRDNVTGTPSSTGPSSMQSRRVRPPERVRPGDRWSPANCSRIHLRQRGRPADAEDGCTRVSGTGGRGSRAGGQQGPGAAGPEAGLSRVGGRRTGWCWPARCRPAWPPRSVQRQAQRQVQRCRPHPRWRCRWRRSAA